MAFKEKTAWIMSLALFLGGVFYWSVVAAGSQELGAAMPPLIPVVAVYVGILVIIAIIGHVAAALTSLKTANDPINERERAITARATSLADSVMGIGILISLGIYLISYDDNQLFHLVFGTLMVSQFLHYAAQTVLFRAQSAVAD